MAYIKKIEINVKTFSNQTLIPRSEEEIRGNGEGGYKHILHTVHLHRRKNIRNNKKKRILSKQQNMPLPTAFMISATLASSGARLR